MRVSGQFRVGEFLKLNSTSRKFMFPFLLDDNTLILFYYPDAISYLILKAQEILYLIYNLSDNSSVPIVGSINQSFVGKLQNVQKINENNSLLFFANRTN